MYAPGSRRTSAALTKLAAKRWRTSFSQFGTVPSGSSRIASPSEAGWGMLGSMTWRCSNM